MNRHQLLFLLLFGMLCSCKQQTHPYTSWQVTGGGKGDGIRYSSLSQIDTSNVSQLTKIWEYHTGDADTVNHSQIQCNPIIIDGVLYGTSPKLNAFAIDAATGEELWNFNPEAYAATTFADFILNNNRGVTYWRREEGQPRILYTAGSYLHALDAHSGELIQSFGNNGVVDLHTGLDPAFKNLFVTATSPGVIYHDLIILGSRVSENSDAAPGTIRAFNVITGELAWTFNTIPNGLEYGHDSWEDPNAWKFIGGANAWSGFTIDRKNRLVFVPTGSASFDFYGGARRGDNLFANSLIALDALTGKYVWHFQFIHHDIWDRDLPTPPALVEVETNGEEVEAVAQPTKSGFIYLFNRKTGEPLYPIEEVEVPTNTRLAGEKLSETQPVPTFPEPIMRLDFPETELNSLVGEESYQELLARYRSYDYEGMFTPLSKKGTIIYPGLDGGAEWGGPAFDPTTGLMYLNANEVPWVITITDVDRSMGQETLYEAGSRLYNQHCMSCHSSDKAGTDHYPSLLDVASRYSAEEIDELIQSGRRMMPAFSYLSDQDREAIISFVINMEEGRNKEYIPEVSTDNPRQLPYTITGYHKFQTQEGYPAIAPPWGTLNAVNLNTGKIAWRIPLGETPEFEEKGIRTGTENYGGPVVTAGGLVFIAATKDSRFRAFNKQTGELLWETELPAPGFATPAIYELKGRQYVVIACGGGKMGTNSGDSYIAYALP